MPDQEKDKPKKDDNWLLGFIKWVGGIVATVIGGVLIFYFTQKPTTTTPVPSPTPAPTRTHTPHPGPSDDSADSHGDHPDQPPRRACENLPNKGAACQVGLGACAQTGTWVCNQAGTGLVCGAVPNQRDNNFHNVVSSNGSWDWNCDGQIERQWGACENLSPAQCRPNTNVTHAPPGFCDTLRKPNGCPPTTSECGHSGYLYPCFYNPSDGRCHAGGYETSAVMACR